MFGILFYLGAKWIFNAHLPICVYSRAMSKNALTRYTYLAPIKQTENWEPLKNVGLYKSIGNPGWYPK